MENISGLSMGECLKLDCTGAKPKTMTAPTTNKETRVLSEMGEQSSVGRKAGLGMLRAEGNTNFYSKPGIMPIFDSTESLDSSKRHSQNVKIRHIHRFLDLSRFPKLDECAHFHYDVVEISTITLTLLVENQENQLHQQDEEDQPVFYINVTSNGKMWTIRRTYENFRSLDRQLHKCIYDRKYSQLPEIPKGGAWQDLGMEYLQDQFSSYLSRLSQLAGPMINCGPVLNWIQMDNRGNRLMVTNESAINTPAVGAAHVTKRYTARAQDELSFEVGDIISVIDMPPPEDTTWWRGKRGFEVGYFPSECIEMIGDTVPQEMASRIPQTPPKAVLRKRGKLISFLRTFFTERPTRNTLKQSGIFIERVFGCDLGEHLLNTGQEVPMVLKCCADFIETHGIIDGIYRLSGVASNIQRLRQIFDENEEPDLNTEEYVQDVHCISSLLKLYFRELPNPLLTYQLYDKFADAVQDDENKLMRVHDAVQQLPPPHYRTSQYLFRHLAKVAVHGGSTGMHPKNLAIVWAPNLLRSKDLEAGCGAAALQGVGLQAVVTEFLIRYADIIFSDKLPNYGAQDKLGLKRARPKSLAISTPTKLLSLEEAREKALCTGSSPPDKQKFIDVGGGPQSLPDKYHTVIDLPGNRKRSHSMKGKKGQQTSSWKNFFLRNKAQNKAKGRKGSMPSTLYPGADKALTEEDLAFRRRLRATKSVDSIISLSPITPDRHSKTNPYSVPGVINVTMLQTGRKLPLSLSVQKPVHKSSSLPDTSFSRAFTLHSDEESDLDLPTDDSPSDENYELGGLLIAKEAAQVAAKTNLMTKLEEKMCDNIDSTSSPDVALLSTSAPVMLMSPLENFLIDDIQSFSWSESSSEQKSPTTESPRTKNRRSQNSPLVSPGRRSLRSSGSGGSNQRRTGSQERLKGSYGKLNRSPSDEIFPMEMTESYDKDELVLVSKTRTSSGSSAERVECRVDVHNRSEDDMPADVCSDQLYRQRSNSYQSALSDAGIVPEEREVKTPDSFTQTPQLDSELDLTNIIDKIFTFSSSVSRDTASSELLSSMVSSETQSRDFTQDEADTHLPAQPAQPAPEKPDDSHPLRKSKSYERAIEGEEYSHRLSGVPSEEEFHVLDTVPEEKSRTPSSEKDLVHEVTAAFPITETTLGTPIKFIDTESTDDVAGIRDVRPSSDDVTVSVGDVRADEFVEQQTPYLHIVERVTPAAVVQLENAGETADHHSNEAASISDQDVANSNRTMDMMDKNEVNNVLTKSRESLTSSGSAPHIYENQEIIDHHGNVEQKQDDLGYFDNSSIHSNPQSCGGSVDNLHSNVDNHHGNLDSLVINKDLKRLMVTPDSLSLSPSEDEHYHLMYSLASTPSLGTLCSTDMEVSAPEARTLPANLDLALDDRVSTCSDYSPNEAAPPPLPSRPPPEDSPERATPPRGEPADGRHTVQIAPIGPELQDFTITYGDQQQSPRGRSPELSLDSDLSTERRLSRSHEMFDLHAAQTDLARSHEMADISAHLRDAGNETAQSHDVMHVSTHSDTQSTDDDVFLRSMTSSGEGLVDRGEPLSAVPRGISPLRTSSWAPGSRESTPPPNRNSAEIRDVRDFPLRETPEPDIVIEETPERDSPRQPTPDIAVTKEVTPDRETLQRVTPTREPEPDHSKRGRSVGFDAKSDNLEAELEKVSSQLSSKKTEAPKRHTSGIAAKFEAKCQSESPSFSRRSEFKPKMTTQKSEEAKSWRRSDDWMARAKSEDRQAEVTGSLVKKGSSSDVRTSGSDVRGSGSDIRGSGSDVRGSGSDVRGSGSDVRGSGSDVRGSGSDVRGSGSDVRGSGSDVRGSASDARSSSGERASSEERTEARGSDKENDQALAGTPVRRKKSVRELTSKFEVDVPEKSKSPPKEERPKSTTEDKIRGFDRQTSLERFKSPSDKRLSTPEPKAKTSPKVAPKWTPPAKTGTPSPKVMEGRPEFPRLGDRNNRSPAADVTSAKSDVTAARSDVTSKPEVVNRPQLKLSETPKWTPQWTPRREEKMEEEEAPRVQKRSPDAEPPKLVQKRSPSPEPELNVSASPDQARHMPMLSNRFTDRPDLFSISAKYREPAEPVPVEPPAPREDVELPPTPGSRIPLLDRRRSVKSPGDAEREPFWVDKNRSTEPEPDPRPSAAATASPQTRRLSADRRLDSNKRISVDSESESSPRPVFPAAPPAEDRRSSLTGGVKRFSTSEERTPPPPDGAPSQVAPDNTESSVAASMFGVKLRKTKRSSIDMDHRQSGEFRQSFVSTS